MLVFPQYAAYHVFRSAYHSQQLYQPLNLNSPTTNGKSAYNKDEHVRKMFNITFYQKTTKKSTSHLPPTHTQETLEKCKCISTRIMQSPRNLELQNKHMIPHMIPQLMYRALYRRLRTLRKI